MSWPPFRVDFILITVLILTIFASFWPSETGQICVFRHFQENAWEIWLLMYPNHFQNWLNYGHDFPHFCGILTYWNRSDLWFLASFLRMHGRWGLEFDMLMYPDHLQNWSDYGHGLDFPHFGSIWFGETGLISGFRAFSEEHIGKMTWCILTTFKTDGVLIFLIFAMSAPWLHAYLTGLWGLRGCRSYYW